VEGFVEEAGETEIADFYFAAGGDHYVCWFQIAVENPVGVQVLTAIQELEHDAFNSRRWDGMPCWLGVVMDDLQKIMLGVLEDHEDTFVFQDNLNQPDDIHMTKF